MTASSSPATQSRSWLRWVPWQTWAALGVALAYLCVYGLVRVQTVGACDSFAYLSHAWRLLGRDAGLQMSLDPHANPSLAPICHVIVRGEVVSIFPVGYSALLAIGGLLGAPYWTTPALSAAGIVLLYESLRRESTASIALGLSALWGATPLVFTWSREVMSDIPATTLLLLAYLLVQRGHAGATGAVLGISVLVRPTNLLFLPVALWVLRSNHQRRRLGCWLLVVMGIGAAYYLGLYASPLPWPYLAVNLETLGPSGLLHQPAYLGWSVLASFWPALALAVPAVIQRPRHAAPQLVWFGLFFLFYCLWTPRVQEAARFILPGAPALFVLAARGAVVVSAFRSWLWLPLVALGLLLNLPILYVKGLLVRMPARRYADVPREVAAVVPNDSLVGAYNYAGPLRLYAGIESVQYPHGGSLRVFDLELRRGRPVFLLRETDMFDLPDVERGRERRFTADEVREYSRPAGTTLWRLARRSGGRPKTQPPECDSPRGCVVDVRGLKGDARNLVDGFVPPAGEAWDVPDAVRFKSDQSYAVLLMPDRRVDAVRVCADSNDSYRIDGSLDGERFVEIGTAPPIPGDGLQTRLARWRARRAWRYLRIQPVRGDGRYAVAEIELVDTGSVLVDFALEDPGAQLVSGWAGAERPNAGSGWRWVIESTATLRVQLRLAGQHLVRVSLSPYLAENHKQQVEVRVNGTSLGRQVLPAGLHELEFDLPGAVVKRSNEVELVFAHALSPTELGTGSDPRTLAAAVHRMRFEPVSEPE